MLLNVICLGEKRRHGRSTRRWLLQRFATSFNNHLHPKKALCRLSQTRFPIS